MSQFTAADYQYMSRALKLARRGLFTTQPNPRVGCVVVNLGVVVGEGWHQRAGEPHAEVFALKQAGELAKGATAYVTLEPCSHTGKTPPCVNALLQSGVTRLVAAMQDPNPKVAGSGLAQLKAQGITVACGLLEEAARELNIGFYSRMMRHRPWVRAKIAASLDGRTSLKNGVSQWITGEAARTDGQRWRARSDAILTGIGTVLADDPKMTVRGFEITKQPLRIVADSQLRTPSTAKILKDGALLACAIEDHLKSQMLRHAGAEIITLPLQGSGYVDLHSLMNELAKREVNELHVEAGAGLTGALVAEGLVDEFLIYLSPTLLGNESIGMFDLPLFKEMDERIDLKVNSLDKVGSDIRILARPVW